MNTTFTFTLWEMGYLVIGILVIVLLLYLISCIKNFVPLLKSTKKILDNVNTVSEITATKAQEIEGAITKILEAASLVADSIKGNQSKTTAVTNLVNAVAALKRLLISK